MGILCETRPLLKTERSLIVEVAFTGRFGVGSQGNSDATEMAAHVTGAVKNYRPAAVLFNLSNLEYEFGDAIGAIAIPLITTKPVNFPKDDMPDCLPFAIENGDLKTGPSTAIMKAAPNCVVPPHYHTAEEQLILVHGEVSTGMEGMQDTLLGPGGFAMMASKQVHWFTCTAKEECLMFVTFNRSYDIVWVKDKK